MTPAQQDGLIRLLLAGALWALVLGWAWVVHRAAERKRQAEDEKPEPLHGFWQ